MQPELMAEAIDNLISNALRYTPPGSRVAISFGNDPPSVCVDDSGPGLPPEEREAVFERFVRGRGASGDGSGLGLAIVREIAAMHGAQVSLCDSALGGLRAVIRLPPQAP
jgi:two-component system sensor histidine kinase TctE